MEMYVRHSVNTFYLILLVCTMSLESQLATISSDWSYFCLYPVTNSILNETTVVKTYRWRYSVAHCGITCSALSTPSFFFDGQTSACFCSNGTGDHAISEETNSSIVYGLLPKKITCSRVLSSGNFTKAGNDSECQALYDTGHRSEAAYSISPDGTQFYCNLSDLGWTVFQRRENGNVDFYRNWLDYVSGFGDPGSEFWMGLENIHQQTKNGCELHIYMEADPNSTVHRGYARYSNFSVGGASTYYTLHVQGFTGNVSDNLDYHNGYAFSTYDMNNDVLNGTNCAVTYKGAWWFGNCFLSHLNGEYLNGTHDLYCRGVIWFAEWGCYSLIRTEMAFRC